MSARIPHAREEHGEDEDTQKADGQISGVNMTFHSEKAAERDTCASAMNVTFLQSAVDSVRTPHSQTHAYSTAHMKSNALADILAGGGGGVVSTFVCSPLDVAKTRLQVQSSIEGVRKYQGMYGTLATIWREEGIRGLYRGLEPSLFTIPCFWSFYFPLYDSFKSQLEIAVPQHHVLGNCVAAIAAGAITDCVTNPLWVVRTRMMTQVYHGDEFGRMHTFTALSYIFRKEGIAGLYKGLAASMVGLSHVGIQFPLYEELKRFASDRRADEGGHPRKGDLIVASACSKFIATSITYPHEVARARMHDHRGASRIGFVETMRTILRREGFAGFYQGLGMNLTRVLPSCVATFVSYEIIKERVTVMLDASH